MGCCGDDGISGDTGHLSMANEVFMWRIELGEAITLTVTLAVTVILTITLTLTVTVTLT